MDIKQIGPKWKSIKGKMKVKWGELTDDELEQTRGRYDRLLSILQKKYKDKIENVKEDFDSWLDSLEE